VSSPTRDAAPVDSNALTDGGLLDAGVMFESAPAPNISPVGACPS
jgi:hypothetical protein